MTEIQSEIRVVLRGERRRWTALVGAATLALSLAAAPAAQAADPAETSSASLAKLIRMFTKKQDQKKETTSTSYSGRSPYVCTLSGFGQKGRCYLRVAYGN